MLCSGAWGIYSVTRKRLARRASEGPITDENRFGGEGMFMWQLTKFLYGKKILSSHLVNNGTNNVHSVINRLRSGMLSCCISYEDLVF